MPTVNITGVILDSTGNPPGPRLRVFLVPAQRTITETALITSQGVEATADAETGAWSVDILPSTETGHGYRLRAWWLGPNPGSEVWFDGPEGMWIIEDGSIGEPTITAATVYHSPTAPDAGVTTAFQLNTTNGDLFREVD